MDEFITFMVLFLVNTNLGEIALAVILCSAKFYSFLLTRLADFRQRRAPAGNEVKRIIELGGEGCPLTISSNTGDVYLNATEKVHILQGVSIVPTSSRTLRLAVVDCN